MFHDIVYPTPLLRLADLFLRVQLQGFVKVGQFSYPKVPNVDGSK
jgi:hypothetical protein